MDKGEAPPMYVCRKCGTHLALQDELISKAFSGRDGKAYLFHSAINIIVGQSEDRNLLTGMHTVADMRCKGCQTVVGWTYLKAWEGSQKYKEGRFIMEHSALHKVNNWS
ncbi:yippee-like protein [Microstroma glucosiphilum]|uniref:Protein yippee-like n=1 Tax=Pseudomicrostroma glucosiphilum TaxID=1684307 RepID=A0A316UB44_9BASI|nr:yippee-like protein [Pseudomicrostroma glucosiphilum]PWN21671.1 yippee-like protein [Pseudomicrostroma glucosiphilum]